MGKITRLTIYSDKLLSNKKILLVSDIHKQKDKKENHLFLIKKELGQEFNDLDYILIPGDIVNDANDLASTSFKNQLQDYLQEFTENKKTIVSPGNHDQMTLNSSKKWENSNLELIFSGLSDIPNLKVLRNGEKIQDNEIAFSAFTPHVSYYTKEKESIEFYRNEFYENYNEKLFESENYNILLTHEPQSIIKLSRITNHCIQANTDLVVSGHMHNGLLPNVLNLLCKNRGILSPQFELFPEFAQGIYQTEDTQFIINGAVNTRVETPIINFLYGYNATVIEMKGSLEIAPKIKLLRNN